MSADTATPSETQTAIMEATYRAFCRHGYADLTIQRIADEFEKSKSLLYYHYDTKDALLVDFLDYLLDRFEAEVTVGPSDNPEERLTELLDLLFPTSFSEDGENLQTALLELRAQAPHKPAYREQFTKSNRVISEQIATTIESGIEAGVFRPVDAEQVATLVMATRNGALLHHVSSNDPEAVRAVREALSAYLDTHLRKRE